MKIQIAGVGLWGRGLTGYSALSDLLREPCGVIEGGFQNPKPEAIAAKERRRAGLMINLAVEVAHQACEHAGIDKRLPPSVFVSAMGDTAITDYMCRKLAAPEKLLSPTKFHNSVHNAPSGYWTISAENRAPSSFVGGFAESFGAGLLEAASQCLGHQQPVLMVAYDIANAAPFSDIEAVSESLGIALLIAPVDLELESFRVAHGAMRPRVASLAYIPNDDAAPVTDAQPEHAALAEVANGNPMGCGLRVLEALHYPDSVQTIVLAAAPAAQLQVTMAPEEEA